MNKSSGKWTTKVAYMVDEILALDTVEDKLILQVRKTTHNYADQYPIN